jgi:arabinofuranosyltransferase
VPMALAAGALLYVAYVVWVGGDFMAGRFLTAPLFAALCAVLSSRVAGPPGVGALLLVLPALLFSVADLGNVVSPPPRGVAPSGIADERQFYLDTLSLAKVTRNRPSADNPMLRTGQRFRTQAMRGQGRRVVTSPNVGLTGYGGGPMVHVIDDLALTDAFLARLPAKRQVPWRIGHFPRAKPRRYVESVQAGRCYFGDADLCLYWTHLRRITEGPVWTWARFLTIAKMNLGMYDHLIDRDHYRNPWLVRIDQERVSRRRNWGDSLDDETLVTVKASGAEVRLSRVRHDRRIHLALSADDGFEIAFVRGGRRVGERRVAPRHGGGLMVRSLRIPSAASASGFDRVRLYPIRGNGDARIGHVRFSRE